MAPNARPRPNKLVDPGTPYTLSADASPGRSTAGLTLIPASGRAPDRTGLSLAPSARSGFWVRAGPPWRSSSSAATDPVGASSPSPTAPVP
jgi:hypothetical protein